MTKRVSIALCLVAVLALSFLPLAASAQAPPPDTSSLLVKLVAGLSAEEQAAVFTRNGGVVKTAIAPLRLYVVEVATADFAATLAAYQADPQVQHAEENKVRFSETIPTDPLYADQWALPKIGWDQVFGAITPAGSAKVALLDTGVDASHPELAGKVIAGTSILDGNNGLIDPRGHSTRAHGWNPV